MNKFNWSDQQDSKPTPWAIHCRKHGKVYLSRSEYNYQMNHGDELWSCPICCVLAQWDDDNYEEALDELDKLEEEARKRSKKYEKEMRETYGDQMDRILIDDIPD